VWMITPQLTEQYGQVERVSVVRAILSSRDCAYAFCRSNPSTDAAIAPLPVLRKTRRVTTTFHLLMAKPPEKNQLNYNPDMPTTQDESSVALPIQGIGTLATVRVAISKVEGRVLHRQQDLLAVEAPLEIQVRASGEAPRSLSVTMRTPGHDDELAAGFLLSEDIIGSVSQLGGIVNSAPNTVVVELSPDALAKAPVPQRGFVMTSACGLCGKESLESLTANRCPVLPPTGLRIDAGVIHRLPQQLRRRQDIFESTGGLHAAALFDVEGELESLREDVGRHNAVDKLVGHALLNGRTPLRDSVMLVSGRASFELVQKATMAGIPVLAAVGAPSSLAVSEAERCGLTLIGFLRNGSFNIYSRSGTACIDGLEESQ